MFLLSLINQCLILFLHLNPKLLEIIYCFFNSIIIKKIFRGTISNGTCFILNTLNGEITTSFTLNYLDNYDPYC